MNSHSSNVYGVKRTRVVDRLMHSLPNGRVEWIGLRQERRGEVRSVNEAKAVAQRGLQGDRRMSGRPDSARQVTFISQEHLVAVSALLDQPTIDPALVRRNVVTSGININALRYRHFCIGDALFQATAYCHPCSRMNENLGEHGFAAMLGHGGICAKVMRSGTIKVGQALRVLNDAEADQLLGGKV